MQKKICSLLFVPCLALCLAFGLLVSCGDEGGGGGEDDGKKPSSSSGYVPPPNKDDAKVFIEDVDTASWIGNNVRIKGNVYITYDGTDTVVIKKITITLVNSATGETVPIQLTDNTFSDSYSLIDGQPSPGLDFTNCKLNGKVKVYVSVFLSTNTSIGTAAETADKQAVVEFEKTLEICRNDLTINTSVEPAGSGTVSLDPAPPYTKNQSVTVTAVPSGNYTFLYWTDDGMPVSCSNPCVVSMDNNKNFTANFSENFTLVKDDNLSKNYKAGDIIVDAVQFTGGSFVAQGSNKLVEFFKLENGSTSDLSTSMIAPDNSLNASKFTPADNSDVSEIDYLQGYYFLVKTTSGGGWKTWYLMYGKNDGACSTAASPKCSAITVWKVP